MSEKAAETIFELVERLLREPQHVRVEYIVATAEGKVITARLTAKNARAMRLMMKHMEP